MRTQSALLALGAAAAVTAMPVGGHAQPVNGLYIAGGAGVNFQDEKLARTTFPAFPGFNSSFNARRIPLGLEPGFAGVVSLGYGFGNGLRVEVEGNFRSNELERLRSGAATGTIGQTRAAGTERKYGVMGNVLYDLPLGLPVQPYFGVGAGYVWTEFDRGRFLGRAVPSPGFPTGSDFSFVSNDTVGSLAVQGIGGVSYNIAAVPGLAVTGEYRFMALPEARTYSFVYSAPGITTPARLRFNDNHNHSIMLGLRYAFGAPRPAPVVVAPPAEPSPPVGVARTYLVFFDWDRADLTGRAREIIAQAANNARSTGTTRIEVAGHADRSGTPQYNQRLSQRRAEVVAAELVRNGVPRGAIGVTAFGESRPLVPTADGVREPQNRRVEIVLR